MALVDSIQNIFRIPELKKRLLFTLGMFAIYRLGEHVPAPGSAEDMGWRPDGKRGDNRIVQSPDWDGQVSGALNVLAFGFGPALRPGHRDA